MSAPELVLITDVETNGVDAKVNRVVEIAGLLWSVKHVSIVSGFSFVIQANDNAAEAINGIPVGLVREMGVPPVDAWARVGAWMKRADIIMAHNAEFDRSFIVTTEADRSAIPSKPWVCTQDDVDWPRAAPGSKLTDILLAHGLGISHAHRALVDVMNIARLLERCAELGHDPATLIARAMRPKATYKAHVTFQTNQLAKEAGFRWSPEHKMWWRKIAEEDAADQKFRFPISRVLM